MPIDPSNPVHLNNHTLMSPEAHARLTAEMDAAMATLPADARLGARYDAKTKTWIKGEGPLLTERFRGFSMGFVPRSVGALLVDLDAPAPPSGK